MNQPNNCGDASVGIFLLLIAVCVYAYFGG